jgi:hypothetical protein
MRSELQIVMLQRFKDNSQLGFFTPVVHWLNMIKAMTASNQVAKAQPTIDKIIQVVLQSWLNANELCR